jgi:hypothetical protein
MEMKFPTADAKHTPHGRDFLSTRAMEGEMRYGFVLPRGPAHRVFARARHASQREKLAQATIPMISLVRK